MSEVILSIEANPKRVNSGAWHRYNAYYVGGTFDDLLGRGGLTARDMKWDTTQGHITWGEGERAEPPPLAPPPPAAPAQTRATTRTVQAPAAATVAAAESSATPSAVHSVRQGRPAVSLTIECRPMDPGTPWSVQGQEVEASAPSSSSILPEDRPWSVRVRTADGTTYRREFSCDRLAQSAVWLAVAHGIDPDDWSIEA